MSILDFTTELNSNGLWYRDEVIELMTKHDVSPAFIKIFSRNEMYRWYPEEVMKIVNNSYPVVEIKKEIPSFLLVDNSK